MVYVDFINRAKKNQISSFNIDFSWRFFIPGAQGCGRILWLLSASLFCRPKINKKIRFMIEKIGSYVVRRVYEPVLYHIQSTVYIGNKLILPMLFKFAIKTPLNGFQKNIPRVKRSYLMSKRYSKIYHQIYLFDLQDGPYSLPDLFI